MGATTQRGARSCRTRGPGPRVAPRSRRRARRTRAATRAARGSELTTRVGSGDFLFQVAESWEQLPAGWSHRDVAGVAVDSRDNVYVFNRSEHPVVVYDLDGRCLRSWGEGVFANAHGI